jgi:hypothetical protein
MEITKKLLTNLMKIMKISGFYITAPGDPSVGIFPANWKIDGDFYFDNQEELEEFRKELNELFTNHCGEGVIVDTFEEDAARTE